MWVRTKSGCMICTPANDVVKRANIVVIRAIIVFEISKTDWK